MSPRVLSLSCNYPSAEEPVRGVFIESRLSALAKLTEVRVVNPASLLDYGMWRTGKFRILPRQIPGERKGVKVYRPRWVYPPGGSFWNALSLASQMAGPLRRIRREYPFDVIDAHFVYPEGIAAALLSRIFRMPFTVTLRGNEPLHCQSRATRQLAAWTLKRASSVIAVSDALRDFALSLGARPARTRTIPNGIDTSIFFPRDRAEARRAHSIPPDARVVLSAGYLIERKGHHRIMQALHDAAALTGPVQLLIAGGPGREGDYTEKLHQLRDTLGMAATVHFLGSVTPVALAELMSAADIFCLATTREGWPNVVNEALACGTPVVATAVGGVTTMLESPECGTMVPVSDPAALREALTSALSCQWDRKTIAAWGQSRDWDHVAADVMRALQQAVSPE